MTEAVSRVKPQKKGRPMAATEVRSRGDLAGRGRPRWGMLPTALAVAVAVGAGLAIILALNSSPPPPSFLAEADQFLGGIEQPERHQHPALTVRTAPPRPAPG